jgi:hypothetical protein
MPPYALKPGAVASQERPLRAGESSPPPPPSSGFDGGGSGGGWCFASASTLGWGAAALAGLGAVLLSSRRAGRA